MSRTQAREAREAREREVREAFAEAAREADPPPLPLAEIEHEGRARRRRRLATALLTVCLVMLAPLGYIASHTLVTTSSSGSTSPSDPTPAGTVRVVASGERVRAMSGVELWLSKDGEHWSTASGPGWFQPVGGRAAHGPALTLHLEGSGNRAVLSGIYRGDVPAARVEVTMPSGATHGTLLMLAGARGWNAWYTTLPTERVKREFEKLRVTVYDARGVALARSGWNS
ncbi:hypothetical protein ACFY0F_14125 [Streptomyces sp. NPDC001544]|uniref:hypothetical protein n=1 Tax=Streptomyces sp. NPDC001544 TaxID=3364584 RepID=UPI00367B58E3